MEGYLARMGKLTKYSGWIPPCSTLTISMISG
jgi:hypothetical protein